MSFTTMFPITGLRTKLLALAVWGFIAGKMMIYLSTKLIFTILVPPLPTYFYNNIFTNNFSTPVKP